MNKYFKPGIKVKISDDLVVGKEYGKAMMWDHMTKYMGKSFIFEGYQPNGTFYLRGTPSGWSGEMMEPVEDTYMIRRIILKGR
jgi:hypothetical protein